ncbi:hypothetical protein ACVCGS_19455 [Klebsiella pneumoniae]
MVEVDEFSDVEIFGFEHGVIPPVANGDVAAGKQSPLPSASRSSYPSAPTLIAR